MPELRELLQLAHQYERAMGITRYLVVATSTARIRRRYRFIVLESDGLEAVAAGMIERLQASGAESLKAELALEEAVAFWGRILSNLRSKRSRRRLNVEQVEIREGLERKFAEGVVEYSRLRPAAVRDAIATRRKSEVEWMLGELGIGSPSYADAG
jgi:hypothetical protein